MEDSYEIKHNKHRGASPNGFAPPLFYIALDDENLKEKFIPFHLLCLYSFRPLTGIGLFTLFDVGADTYCVTGESDFDCLFQVKSC